MYSNTHPTPSLEGKRKHPLIIKLCEKSVYSVVKKENIHANTHNKIINHKSKK